MSKLEIIATLEGRLVQVLGGQWYQVQGGQIQTPFTKVNIRNYEIGQLELMLRTARKD
jgi:hypothetical protein